MADEISRDIAVLRKLSHWGRVTLIRVGNLTTIGSDNGVWPDRRQAIIWTNAGILLIGPLGINLSEILIEISTFSFKKMNVVSGMASISSRAQCVNFCLKNRLFIGCYLFTTSLPTTRCLEQVVYCMDVDGWGPVCNGACTGTPQTTAHWKVSLHYNDVIMSAMVSQITSLTIVHSSVYSRRASKKTSKLCVTGLCEEFTGDRWIPHTKGQ